MLVKVAVPTELIRRFQCSAPVDVVALSRALGLNAWESSALPPGISGKLFKDPSHGGVEGYSIVVRSDEPFVRKRFTIAHELAHFMLHRDRVGAELADDTWYRSGLSSREEAEANRMAADILMPWHLLDKYSGKPAPELAQIFEVSTEAMRVRLGLNYIAADLARSESAR